MGESSDDVNVGVEIGWSSSGISAKLKSRAISAIDRLCGSKVAKAGLNEDREIALHQAITRGQVTVIEAAFKKLASDVSVDDQAAERLSVGLQRTLRQQESIEAAVSYMLEDLRDGPAATESEMSDKSTLGSEFLNRFEHYAGGASSEEMRERWGRVLASEVRKPGTFSAKVLRVVDELDLQTAQLFEKIFSFAVAPNLVPTLTTSSLWTFEDAVDLENADLVARGGAMTFDDKSPGVGDYNFAHFERCGIGISPNAKMKADHADATEFLIDELPAMNIFYLTSAGAALGSIIGTDFVKNTSALKEQLSMMIDGNVRLYIKDMSDGSWTVSK